MIGNAGAQTGHKQFPVKNTASSAVPPFGLMRVTGILTDGYAEIAQPTADNPISSILVNGQCAIPAGAYGAGTATFPGIIAYNPASATGTAVTPAAGEDWGVDAGSWLLTRGRVGFQILGAGHATKFLVNAMPKEWGGRWQPFTNGASQTASAYGVLRITGSTSTLLTAARPNGTYGIYAINSSSDVAATTGLGVCTQDYPALALYDDADGTPANGQVWGPGTDTFKLKKHFQGYVVVGDVDTTNKLCYVVPQFAKIKGKLDAELSFQGSAAMSVWTGSGAGSDTGINVTVYDWLLTSPDTLAIGTKITAYYEHVSGIWVLDAAQC